MVCGQGDLFARWPIQYRYEADKISPQGARMTMRIVGIES
jgi:hypothetical protein